MKSYLPIKNRPFTLVVFDDDIDPMVLLLLLLRFISAIRSLNDNAKDVFPTPDSPLINTSWGSDAAGVVDVDDRICGSEGLLAVVGDLGLILAVVARAKQS